MLRVGPEEQAHMKCQPISKQDSNLGKRGKSSKTTCKNPISAYESSWAFDPTDQGALAIPSLEYSRPHGMRLAIFQSSWRQAHHQNEELDSGVEYRFAVKSNLHDE